jgi:Uma2 family endonuclease
MAEPRRRYSLDDYFVVEADSVIKHEYYRGEIFAMAGASVAHNHIAANVLALLRFALRGTGCNAFGSDLRVHTPGGLFTYPDVSVICGRVELVRDRPDTATNPTLLVEVLAEATGDYDRGEKFSLYKTIPTLREYLLIEQGKVAVEHWRLAREQHWARTVHKRLAAIVKLISVRAELPLSEIYREVV